MGLGLDNPLHIAFLLLVVMLLFGARRLPEMGRSLGEGMRGFKDALTGHGETQQKLTAAAGTQPPAAAQSLAAAQSPEPPPAG